MTSLAVALVALAACGYAVGARLQHGAVRNMVGDRKFGIRSQLRLLRNHQWLLGVVALGGGALLHASALGLAPLSVVQPVGVLALPLTVLLSAKQRNTRVRDLKPNVALAVAVSTAAVAAFVFLAAGSATATSVDPRDEVLATQLAGAGVLVLAIIGALTRSKVRCVACAAGCAVAYGYVSLLMRGVVQELGTVHLNLVPLVGVVSAAVVGAWLLQHGYASGPPDLVVACLTVIDPLVAVGLGVGLLGEADRVDAGTATGEIICALTACAGVFALARHHPQTQEQQPQQLPGPTSVIGGSDIARQRSIDRPDGSTT